jgi:hypothetical protein
MMRRDVGRDAAKVVEDVKRYEGQNRSRDRTWEGTERRQNTMWEGTDKRIPPARKRSRSLETMHTCSPVRSRPRISLRSCM